MGDFTRAGDIAHPVDVPIRIGDVWVERKHADAMYPIGRVCVVDRYPFDDAEPAAHVAVEWLNGGQRERKIDAAEFRRRFAFRKAAL